MKETARSQSASRRLTTGLDGAQGAVRGSSSSSRTRGKQRKIPPGEIGKREERPALGKGPAQPASGRKSGREDAVYREPLLPASRAANAGSRARVLSIESASRRLPINFLSDASPYCTGWSFSQRFRFFRRCVAVRQANRAPHLPRQRISDPRLDHPGLEEVLPAPAARCA